MPAAARQMVLAAFTADALALGAHWIYDTRRIDRELGRVTELRDPRPPTYHPTKVRGDFTHYGDQTLVLLESMAARGGFDAEHFAGAWQAFFGTYTGYFDGATRKTLENIGAGKKATEAGSGSDDLAGAARIAPLVFAYRRSEARLAEAARQQTRMTHDTPEVAGAAEYFARVARRVLAGQPVVEALVEVRDAFFRSEPFGGWVDDGIESAAEDTRQAIGRFGQMCEAPAAFPATVHLIARYADRLEEGLIENVMAGGDSAGRGMIAGMVLGACSGAGGLPERWLSALRARERIERLLDLLDAALSPPG